MSQTLTISDELYVRLEHSARQQGFDSVEQLLDAWQHMAEGRKVTVQRVDALRARLFKTYGTMPDSTELVREDRER